jgi:hypothetical protein
MLFMKRCVPSLATLALASLAAGGSLAEEMSLTLQNPQSTPLQVELYSRARAHNWPEGGASYEIGPGATQSFQLSCTDGESICYGAWVPGSESTYFGVGQDAIESCEHCCFTCESGARAAFVIGK